mgnify:CR=1 FL=1
MLRTAPQQINNRLFAQGLDLPAPAGIQVSRLQCQRCHTYTAAKEAAMRNWGHEPNKCKTPGVP